LCTWAQPTVGLSLLGQAAQPPWVFQPMAKETRGKSPSTPVAVGRRGSCLGANPVDDDPDLGRRVAGRSTELSCDGDGGRADRCIGEGVSRLSLAQLVRSASISELGRPYWRGQRGWRSTGGGGRWWPVKKRKWWLMTS
jgi:hypothetical protein